MRAIGKGRPVFFDPSGWRRTILSFVTVIGCTLLGGVIACLAATIVAGPTLPLLKHVKRAQPTSAEAATLTPIIGEPPVDGRKARTVAPTAASALRYGYLVNWDDNSFSSLKRNAPQLDAAILEWLYIPDSTGSIAHDDGEKETLVLKWAKSEAPSLRLMPLVNNYDRQRQVWDGKLAADLLASRSARQRFVAGLLELARGHRYHGVVLDFEELPADAYADYVALVQELHAKLSRYGVKLLVAAPPADPLYPLEAVAAAADAVILMTYDEHSEKGQPGPLAGQGWFEKVIDERLRAVDPQKVIISIGSYGYDWSGTGQAQEISVQEAWELAEESGAKLRFDKTSLNPSFTYESEGTQHGVWFLDGVTAHNQIAAALARGPAGLALWRLGTEDPSVWSTFGRGRIPGPASRQGIQVLNSGYDILYRGKGEVLNVSGQPQPGLRELVFDPATNLIVDQRVAIFPKGLTITRSGARSDKVVALTFDDGPDPRFTPQILDILKQKDVAASFFVVGSVAARNRWLVQRMYLEGHDIGNHTFSHVNSAHVPEDQLKLELNATERLLKSTIGVRTILFRPPYAQDIEPQTIDAARALRIASSLGYITVGMNIDPKDWMRPLPKQIVKHTVSEVVAGKGNVVLLHDAGGGRGATVAALPGIIDELRANGFRFVALHELIGLSRDEAMPRVQPEEHLMVAVNHAGFTMYSGASWLMGALFQVGILLGTLRLLLVGGAAIVHARRERARWVKSWKPRSFAVLIPSYNEETVICSSIQALLNTRLRKFEIVVVDDGSTDRTVDVVRRQFGHTKRVRVLTKPNGGKWSALNYGLQHITADVVVSIDADTQFEPDALALLLRHFEDPNVGAVAGAACVGNRINLMTRFQALEYVTSQNLDRRALELVNGITVVPGAIGAWRRTALLQVGGYSPDTLAEDADATIRLARAGWKVLYEPRALARTEAPETVRAFMKQRFRWMFGTLQVAYKHLDAFRSRKAAGVAICGLTNTILFQFLFTLISPFIDIMLLWSIAVALNPYGASPAGDMQSGLGMICAYWAFFQVLDLATAALAISIERQRGLWRLLPLLLIQRFFYRQLLYVTAVRTALSALKGQMVGWNKLLRTGNVVTVRGREAFVPAPA